MAYVKAHAAVTEDLVLIATACRQAATAAAEPRQGGFARRGLAAIDADDDPLLARSVDAAGNVVEEREEPETPDFAWLSRHSWAWNPARLDELIGAAAPATLYVCGGADNELELADRFTQVSCWRSTSPRCWRDWMRAGTTTTGAVSGTLASTYAAGCRKFRPACAHSARSPLMPGSPSAKWWTRYSPTRWLAPPRAKPASRAISPAPDPRSAHQRAAALGILADQVRAGHLDQAPGRQHAEVPVNAAHDRCEPGLSGARPTGQYQVLPGWPDSHSHW